MTCEIENTVTRPNGPFGDVVTNGRCLTHSFRTYGVAMNGQLCPIGQIEEATAKALAQIAGTATAGQAEPVAVDLSMQMVEGELATVITPVKRPRKPKSKEE